MNPGHEDAVCVMQLLPIEDVDTVTFGTADDNPVRLTMHRSTHHRLGHPQKVMVQVCPHVSADA